VLQPIGWMTTIHDKPRLHCTQQWY